MKTNCDLGKTVRDLKYVILIKKKIEIELTKELKNVKEVKW